MRKGERPMTKLSAAMMMEMRMCKHMGMRRAALFPMRSPESMR